MESNASDRLCHITLLEDLSPEKRREFEKLCTWQMHDVDDVVFDSETDSREVYFVVSGAVRIVTDSPYKREKDEKVTFADFSAGNYFGELAAIDNLPRSARVISTETTELASLGGANFLRLVAENPSVSLKLVKRLTKIIRSLDKRVAQLSTLSESERVYSELIRIARPDPVNPDHWAIPNMPKHNEIASWAGTSRETVAQVIGDLARTGVVERRSFGMTINDWQRLRLLAKSSH